MYSLVKIFTWTELLGASHRHGIYIGKDSLECIWSNWMFFPLYIPWSTVPWKENIEVWMLCLMYIYIYVFLYVFTLPTFKFYFIPNGIFSTWQRCTYFTHWISVLRIGTREILLNFYSVSSMRSCWILSRYKAFGWYQLRILKYSGFVVVSIEQVLTDSESIVQLKSTLVSSFV